MENQETIFQNSFLRHPKFQDLEKTKKTKRTKKTIISELFLETPQIPRPRKKQKKTLFQNSFLRHPKFQDLWKIVFFCFFWFSASPLENCFFVFVLFFWFSARPLENWFCWFLKKVLQMFIHMHLQRSFPLRISLKNNVLPRVWHSDKHKTL